MPPNADYAGSLRVVGIPTVDEFWWKCDACQSESERQPLAQIAYGLARCHAAWHGWDTADIYWGWLAGEVPPIDGSER